MQLISFQGTLSEKPNTASSRGQKNKLNWEMQPMNKVQTQINQEDSGRKDICMKMCTAMFRGICFTIGICKVTKTTLEAAKMPDF